MGITHLADLATADTVCALLGIAHETYSKDDVNEKSTKYYMARGSWVEHREESMKTISSFVMPGDRVQLFPLFTAAAEAHLTTIYPNTKQLPQKTFATVMCLAMFTEHSGELDMWDKCLSSLESLGDISGSPAESICSFFVRNKEWLQIQMVRSELPHATDRLLQRLDREGFCDG